MGHTTLRIDEELLRRLRRRAADEDRTLQEVTNEALRRGLESRPSPSDDRLELDSVALTRDLPEHGLECTDVFSARTTLREG